LGGDPAGDLAGGRGLGGKRLAKQQQGGNKQEQSRRLEFSRFFSYKKQLVQSVYFFVINVDRLLLGWGYDFVQKGYENV